MSRQKVQWPSNSVFCPIKIQFHIIIYYLSGDLFRLSISCPKCLEFVTVCQNYCHTIMSLHTDNAVVMFWLYDGPYSIWHIPGGIYSIEVPGVFHTACRTSCLYALLVISLGCCLATQQWLLVWPEDWSIDSRVFFLIFLCTSHCFCFFGSTVVTGNKREPCTTTR